RAGRARRHDGRARDGAGPGRGHGAPRMTRATLSVVVITLNEEERVRECLDSVAWADEIIVVDAESQDKTAAIARELTDHVIVRPWPGFAAQKNFGLAAARGAWILSLDADEIVSPPLRAENERIVERDG